MVSFNKIPEVDSNKQDRSAKNKIRVSSWVKMKRVLALVMLFKSELLSKVSEGKTCLDSKSNDMIDVQMMEEVKKFIIRMVQKRSFGTEVKTMRSNGKKQYIKRESPLYRLDPFIVKDGIIRVGGRLKKSTYNENILHPIVLPKDVIISKKILE